VCTLGGTRFHEFAIIALFDPEDVKLPLSGEMFKSSNPEREVPDPWLPGTSYDEMNHNGHAPWGIKPEDAMRCREQGGPDAILTEHGWLPLAKEGLAEPEVGKEQLTDEELEAEWNARLIQHTTPKVSPHRTHPPRIRHMQQLREDGLSNQAIGDLVGKSREWVRKKLKKAGE
jgi:hypothetical protein